MVMTSTTKASRVPWIVGIVVFLLMGAIGYAVSEANWWLALALGVVYGLAFGIAFYLWKVGWDRPWRQEFEKPEPKLSILSPFLLANLVIGFAGYTPLGIQGLTQPTRLALGLLILGTGWAGIVLGFLYVYVAMKVEPGRKG